jgi:hypothetical protein
VYRVTGAALGLYEFVDEAFRANNILFPNLLDPRLQLLTMFGIEEPGSSSLPTARTPCDLGLRSKEGVVMATTPARPIDLCPCERRAPPWSRRSYLSALEHVQKDTKTNP